MTLLSRNPKTGYFTELGDTYLNNVHDPRACEGRGCAVHDHPSDHALNRAPLNWREDRNILERVCKHGVGHPDFDSAEYLASIGRGFENDHGCDGCC